MLTRRFPDASEEVASQKSACRAQPSWLPDDPTLEMGALSRIRTYAAVFVSLTFVAVMGTPLARGAAATPAVVLSDVSTSYRSTVEIPVQLLNGQPFSHLQQTFTYDPQVLTFTGIVGDLAAQSATLSAASAGRGRILVEGTGSFIAPAPDTTLYYLSFRAKAQTSVTTAVQLVRSLLGNRAQSRPSTATVQLVYGWTNIGPFNINTGTGLHSAQSGVVSAVGFAPGSDILYLASGQAHPMSGPGGYPGVTGDGGIYKSNDGGQTWSFADLGLSYTDVTALAVDPTNPQVAVIEVEGPEPTTGLIYKTVNGGETWQETYPAGGYGLEYKGTTLYATTFHAILASADFGTTWHVVASFPHFIVTASAVSSDEQTMYVGVWKESTAYTSGVKSAYAEVLASTDGGKTFSESLNVDNVLNPSISQIVINPTQPQNVFVVTSSPYLGPENGNPSLYETTDAGATWAMIDTVARGLPNATPVQYIAVDPQQGDVVYGGVNGGLYRSIDDGASFSQVPNFFFDVRCVVFDPQNDQRIYVGTDQGLYASQDGGSTFSPLNNRPGTLIYDIATDGTQIFTTVQDMSPVYSPDDGNSWTVVNRGELGIVAADPYDPLVVLMWTEPHVTGFFYVSEDAGKIFSAPQIDETQQENTEIWTASGFAFDKSGAIFLAGGQGIFESTDKGQTWQLLPGSPSDAQTVAVGVDNPAVVYAASWNGLFVSHDYGATWTKVSSDAFNSLAVDPQNSSIVVGSQYNPSLNPNTFGLQILGTTMVSTDDGASFTETSMHSEDHFTTFPQVMFATGASGPVLIYTCQSGVYASLNLGRTWRDVSFNLPDRAVTSLTLSSHGTAYISTYGAGVWTYPNFLAALGE